MVFTLKFRTSAQAAHFSMLFVFLLLLTLVLKISVVQLEFWSGCL